MLTPSDYCRGLKWEHYLYVRDLLCGFSVPAQDPNWESCRAIQCLFDGLSLLLWGAGIEEKVASHPFSSQLLCCLRLTPFAYA